MDRGGAFRHIDVDVDIPVQIDKTLIQDVDSKTIIERIKDISPSVTFEHDGGLTHKVVNMSRFMMAGMGFKPRYWLCSGASSLEKLMKYNFIEEDFSNLVKVTDREDVFTLFSMPLFYGSDTCLEDALYMVSDLSGEEVKIHYFLLSDRYGNEANDAIVATEQREQEQDSLKYPAPRASFDDNDLNGDGDDGDGDDGDGDDGDW